MVFIINSDDFKIDSTCISSQILGAKVTLKGFPTFYSDDGKYINPINLWVNYLVNVLNYINVKQIFWRAFHILATQRCCKLAP